MQEQATAFDWSYIYGVLCWREERLQIAVEDIAQPAHCVVTAHWPMIQNSSEHMCVFVTRGDLSLTAKKRKRTTCAL